MTITVNAHHHQNLEVPKLPYTSIAALSASSIYSPTGVSSFRKTSFFKAKVSSKEKKILLIKSPRINFSPSFLQQEAASIKAIVLTISTYRSLLNYF